MTNINKYENIIWNLPLLFQADIIWGAIYNQIKSYGFKPPKVNLYGTPAQRWIGGTIPRVKEKLQKNVLYEHFKYIKELEATPILDFTSTNITKEELKDEYANYLLDIALEFNSDFMVYSDILKDYIKEKNPNAKIISSHTKPVYRFQGPNRVEDPTVENETNYYNKLLKEYDTVIVRPEYSKYVLCKNPSLIDDISRIEVLVNQPCIINCPKMSEHYTHIENANIIPQYYATFECSKKNMPAQVLYENNLVHSEEKINNLIQIGVKNLMLILKQVDALPLIAYETIQNMFNTDGNNHLLLTETIPHAIRDEISKYNERINRIINSNNQI